MSTKVINPFESIGVQFSNGMATIEGGLSAAMDVNDLNTLIVSFVNGLYFPSPNQFDTNQLSSVLPAANNGYINKSLNHYTDVQHGIINNLMEQILTSPINSIDEVILDFEDNIAKSGLPWEDQAPLLLATEIGIKSHSYWTTKVNTPANNWYTQGFFDSNAYVNYANIPHWVNASIWGVLVVGDLAKTYGLFDPPRIIGIDILSALTGGLAVSSGKVLFNWTPTVQSIISDLRELNNSCITRLNSSNVGVGMITKTFTRSCLFTCRAPKCCPTSWPCRTDEV